MGKPPWIEGSDPPPGEGELVGRLDILMREHAVTLRGGESDFTAVLLAVGADAVEATADHLAEAMGVIDMLAGCLTRAEPWIGVEGRGRERAEQLQKEAHEVLKQASKKMEILEKGPQIAAMYMKGPGSGDSGSYDSDDD